MCAAKAARTDSRDSGVWWYAAARTAAQGPSGVTGESLPKAIGTPADRNAANGFVPRARSAPSRCTYMPSSPPHSASKTGWTLAKTPRRASTAMPSASIISTCSIRCRAARSASTPLLRGLLETGEHRVHRPVADDVEAALQAGLGARHHVVADLGGGEVADAVGRVVGVDGAQARGVRAERPVGEQVSGGTERAELAGLVDAAQLAPVADDVRSPPSAARASIGRKSSSEEISGPPHSCTAPMPSAAARRSAAPWASRRCPDGDRPEGHLAGDVVGVAREHPLGVVPGEPPRSGAAASRADETTAECTSIRVR